MLGGFTWWFVDDWRLRRMLPQAATAALYRRLYRYGRRLALPLNVAHTPYESAARLTARMTQLGRHKRFAAKLAPSAQEVRWLTDLYVRAFYSLHQPSDDEKAQAIQTWYRLRRRLWLAWMRRKG